MNKFSRKLVSLGTCIAICGTAVLTGGCSGNSSKSSSSNGGKIDMEALEKEEKELKPDYSVNYDGIKTASINAGVGVHDPSILKVDDTYYIYGSHMSTAKSTDLRNWTSIGDGYDVNNPVYKNFLRNDDAFKYAGGAFSAIPTDDNGTHVWAPDVVYNKKQKKYFMYFCTSSTWNASNLCYATSESPEGPFEWQGALIYSGFTSDTLKDTDVLDYVSEDYAKEHYINNNGGMEEYNYNECPNAIDPTTFYDEDGKMWMVYGSWSGGIFLLEIDENTGKVIHPEADEKNNVDAYFGKRLIGGGHVAIEGPWIEYDKEAGYYYLFVSYGSLVSDGGYQIRVFRSKKVNGDYVDMKGNTPKPDSGDESFFGLKLSGNYMLPSLEKAYMATGHNSALIDTDGKRYIVNHTRFDDGTEAHEPRVHQYLLNEDGWPCMLPYATDGETVSEKGYDNEKIIGDYYVVDQDTTVDGNIAEPFKLIFTDKGSVFGKDIKGVWTVKDGTYYVTIKYNDDEFKGVFCEMNDEAGTKCMTFSAVSKNKSLWGVKYYK